MAHSGRLVVPVRLVCRFGSVLPELPDEDAESDAGTENLKNSKTIRKRK